MKNIILYEPKIEDYWYEEKIQSDPLTMSYNAGYNVSYFGYHYDTGCIDFPKDKWEEMFDKRKDKNYYFAYIKDNDLDEFIGYVNYHLNSDKYECSILIEDKYRKMGYGRNALMLLCDVARSNGIKELYDSFEANRDNTLTLFENVGFQVVEHTKWMKFNHLVDGVVVKKELVMNDERN